MTTPDLNVDVRLPSHPRYLEFVRLMAGEAAAIAGFADEDKGRIELAVVEGFSNVIRHGYGNATDRRIDLHLWIPAGAVKFEIEDWGTWVDPAKMVSRPLDQVRPGGLGIHLMKSTMDVVEYRRNPHGGTTLVLEKRVAPAPTPGGSR